MKKFRVNVTKNIYLDGIAEVEAENEDLAKKEAMEMIEHNSGKVEWWKPTDELRVGSAREI